MTIVQLPAPKNRLVTVVNIVIDFLIKGLTVDVAHAAILAAEPWLANPFTDFMLKELLGWLGGAFDIRLKINADIVVVRIQHDVSKAAFDVAFEKLKAGDDVSPEELQRAKDAADAVIHGSR